MDEFQKYCGEKPLAAEHLHKNIFATESTDTFTVTIVAVPRMTARITGRPIVTSFLLHL
jgi:hypothetical protein